MMVVPVVSTFASPVATPQEAPGVARLVAGTALPWLIQFGLAAKALVQLYVTQSPMKTTLGWGLVAAVAEVKAESSRANVANASL